MLVSDTFTDPKSIDLLRTFFHEHHPCRHGCMDDFFTDAAFQDMQIPALVQDVTRGEVLQAMNRIVNDTAYGKLIHVPKEAIVRVPYSTLLSNHLERYGTLWKRMRLIVFLDDVDPDEGGFFELYHVVSEKPPVLQFHVPPKQNRMVFHEVHPHTFTGFSPVQADVSFRVLLVHFFTHEPPEWYQAGSVESRMDRPEDE